MKTPKSIIAIILYSLIMVLVPESVYTVSPTQRVLKGKVLAQDTMMPIKNARVNITGTKYECVTGGQGGFTLISPGEISSITISCFGFIPATIEIDHKVNELIEILLERDFLHLREEVKVTGPVIDKAVQNVVLPEKITQAKSVETADALLTDLAGIDVQRTSTGGAKGKGVFIRGFGESRSLILLNGRPLNGSGVMGGDYVDWSSLSTQDIEHIEVIRGAKSAEYGNTLGGVINLVTKKGTTKARTDLAFSYGANRTANGMISHKGHIKDILFYSFSAGNWVSDGYLRNNQVERKTFAGNITLALPAGTTLEFGGRYTFHERGFIVENQEGDNYYHDDFPESLSSAGGGPGVQFKGGDYTWGDGSYWKNIRQQYDVRFKKSFGKMNLEAAIYLNDQDRTEYFYAITDREKLILERYSKPEDMTWGWHAKATMPIKNHRIKYGLEGVHLRYGGGEITAIDRDYFNKQPSMTGVTVEAVKRHSFFLDDRWSVTEEFSLNLGLRYDNYQGQNPETEGVGNIHIQGFSPKLGVVWDIWQHGNIEFSLSKALRFPTCPEYYWYYAGYQPAERATLSPEEGLQWELGISRRLGQAMTYNFRVYYYRVSNYIRTIFGYRPSRVVYNVEQARFMGMELELVYQFMPQISVSLNYTFQSAKKEGDVLDMSNELTNTLTELPEYKLNARLEYKGKGGIKADLCLRYVGGRSVLLGDLSVLGAIVLESMPGYITADIHASVELIKKMSFGWDLKLAVENIFNVPYEEVYGFPMPGRRLFVGMDINF